jgi:hypothetical protein
MAFGKGNWSENLIGNYLGIESQRFSLLQYLCLKVYSSVL